MKKEFNAKICIAITAAVVSVIAAIGTVLYVKQDKKTDKKTDTVAVVNDRDTSVKNDISIDYPDDSFIEEDTTEAPVQYEENEVVNCERQILTDPATGVAVMSLLVPEGWNASVQVDWTYYNETNPGRAFVLLSSPDGSIEIMYISKVPFVQTNSSSYIGNYNRNALGVATELDYMSAYDYSMHMLNAGKVTMLTSESTEVDSSKQDNIRNFAYQIGEQSTEYFRAAVGRETQGLQYMSGDVAFSAYDGQVAIQHGESNINGRTAYTETICEEIMYEHTLYIYASGLPTSEQVTRVWVPYMLTIANFTDEATYNENFELYRFLVSNMVICADFEYLNSVLGSQYVQNAIQANIEIQNYAHEVMQQYQRETMQQEDAFVDNFCDYIKDQTTYTMDDGSRVVVPIDGDYVYSNGTDVIWSTSPSYDPGPGYTQIN